MNPPSEGAAAEMTADEALHRARRAFGRRAPGVLAPLGGGTQPLGAALAFDLEALRLPSGRWDDLGSTTPGRLLDLPILALHDLGVPTGVTRESIEAALLDAGALSVAAIFLAEAVVGAEAGCDPPSAVLLGSLVAAATARAAEIAPSGAGLRFAASWGSHAEALARAGRRTPEWTAEGDPVAPEVLAALGRRHAPLGALFAQALEAGGRPELVAPLASAFEAVAGLHQLVRDFEAVHRDLARGWWSLPIARLASAVGALPTDDSPPSASPVCLAALLTRAMPSLARAALSRVESAAHDFAEAGLASVRAAVETLADPLRAVLQKYEFVPSVPIAAAPVAFRVESRPRREQALASLRAALDDDPASREAWFIRRGDRPGHAPEVDRLSGPATVLENRVRAGERRPTDVDALIDALCASPERPEVDALAALARLVPDASDPRAAQRRLQTSLSRSLVAPTTPCAGTLARLALGLLRWPNPPPETRSVAIESLERVSARGAEAFAVHDPLHGALLVLELSEALRAHPAPVSATARSWALAFAARWQGRAAASPLAAAWLWEITAFSDARALRDPRWRERMLRAQRAAGTWDACPFLRAPSPGLDRPASRLVTTSFVYRSLADDDALR